MKLYTQDYGLDLAVFGSLITSAGVLVNNVLLDHIGAMIIWVPSNTIFTIYFFGRWRDWWDGRISDAVMCATYFLMLSSEVWGLHQSGVILLTDLELIVCGSIAILSATAAFVGSVWLWDRRKERP